MISNFSFLQNRSLLTIGISESVSNIGNWITMMAIYALVIFKGEGNVLQSSGIYLAGLLPILLFSPAAGWLADHYDRKWLMITSEVCAGLVIAGLIFTTRLEWIYLLMALQALFVSLMAPARRAVIPALVDKEDLPRANAFLEQLSGIIKISAPILAGAILAIMNPHQAIILDVVSFALSALILSRLPALPPPQVQPKKEVKKTQKPQPTIWIVLHDFPQLGLLYACIFASITIIVGFDVLAPIYTRDILQGHEQLFGTLIAAVGAGTLAGTMALMLMKGKRSAWREFFIGLFLLACIPLVMAFSSLMPSVSLSQVIAILGCFVGGIGNGWLHVQSATLLQTLSPREFLGRLGGIFESMATSGQLVGVLISPLLVPALLPLSTFFLLDFVLLMALLVFSSVRLHKINSMNAISNTNT